jgi:hypothetical protein
VAAVPLVPLVTGHLLFLIPLQGPALFLITCTALVVAASRARKVAPRPSPVLLFAAAFAFYAFLGKHLPGPSGPQGDEPHYLLMCQSLLSDGDLDLSDDYANREYGAFFAGSLSQPHVSGSSRAGRSYSFHSPGLPLLLLPGYALGGYLGVRVMLWAFAALSGVLVHRLVRESLGDEDLALAAWAGLVFVPPLPFFAMRVYPETVALLATAAFLLTARRRLDARSAGAAAACAALLPWLHSKFVVLAALGLLLTLARPGRWVWRAAVLVAFAASLALLLVTFHGWYGRASLSAAYGEPDLLLPACRATRRDVFDRQFSLFPSAPSGSSAAVHGAGVSPRTRSRDPARRAGGQNGGGLPDWSRHVRPTLRAPRHAGLAWAWAQRSGGGGRSRRPRRPGLILALAASASHLQNSADGESHLLRFLSPAVDLNAFFPRSSSTGGPALPRPRGGAAPAWRFGLVAPRSFSTASGRMQARCASASRPRTS